ncbi:MAG: aminotransferase class V-fold PLP-dependent enzyme [Verrucomicrobia bacterium]|nr:aminotransferase class V-fold PLP-dependent enzyme [Verrucomicrobiota bacterium]
MKIEGKPKHKIGIEEFMSITERFGFSKNALRRIRRAVSEKDLGRGPNLARWATAHPPKTKSDQFEALARRMFAVKHARGVSSGTGALHSAMAAVGVGPGTEVIVPAIGFLATSAVVVTLGGRPVFCDVDDSFQIDPTKIEPLITPHTVALAPTHWSGGVCNLAPILRIARQHNLKVIEDCAQAPGATYRGRYVGAIGDMGCFSISAYKIIGGGEGGMIVTNDRRLFERAAQFAECGGLWRLPGRFAPPRYQGELFCGSNYRMSELEAAVDVVQLRKLDGIFRRFHTNHIRIRSRLKSFAGIHPAKMNDPDGEVGYNLRLIPENFDLGRRIVEALRGEGISCGMRGPKAAPDWHLASEMFPLQAHAPSKGVCPVADDLYNRSICISIDQWWSAADCRNIAKGINRGVSAVCAGK